MRPPTDHRASLWVVITGAISILVGGADLGDRFWGSATSSQVTSYQVAQLTAAVRDLANKFDGMPKQAAVDAIAAREDRSEAAISTLQQGAAAMRADLDNMMHPARPR